MLTGMGNYVFFDKLTNEHEHVNNEQWTWQRKLQLLVDKISQHIVNMQESSRKNPWGVKRLRITMNSIFFLFIQIKGGEERSNTLPAPSQLTQRQSLQWDTALLMSSPVLSPSHAVFARHVRLLPLCVAFTVTQLRNDRTSSLSQRAFSEPLVSEVV